MRQRHHIAHYTLHVSGQGVIQHSTINNLAFGRNVDEVLRTLQAIQYVQKNPDEVCPAGTRRCAAGVCAHRTYRLEAGRLDDDPHP